MIPWELVDSATIEGETAPLKLMRRGGEFSIMLAGNELMGSRSVGSEQALATETASRVTAAAPRVLVGGLGMGFTLRAAQAAFEPAARFTVAEIVPAVVAWARGPLAGIFAGSLDDPRVTVAAADVAALIAREPGAWDAILLDVDNGPRGLSRRDNDRLYAPAGLAAARAALRPGGVLAVWSAVADESFTRRLRRAGFAVEERHVRARGKRGARHVIWLATVGPEPRE